MLGSTSSPLAFEDDDVSAADFGAFDDAVADRMRAANLHTLILGNESLTPNTARSLLARTDP